MHKTVIGSHESDLESPDVDTTASSFGVVTHHDGYRHVSLSGIVWPEEETAPEQVEVILGFLESLFEDGLDASLDDVTAMRFYVDGEVLTTETRASIHEVRHEFFEAPHLPASTMVGVSDRLDHDALVEVEVEATVPGDGWEVDVLALSAEE